MTYFRFIDYICTFLPPKQWYCMPPTLTPGHASSPFYPPLRPPVFGWLLCFGPPIGSRFTPPCILFQLFLHCSIQHPKQWDSVSPCPLKAKATPIALFFDGVCVGIPNEGTGRGTAKPDHGRLAWDHRRPQRHVLVAPLSYPWRERAKPLGGRAAASHVGCCVFCVVVFRPGPFF